VSPLCPGILRGENPRRDSVKTFKRQAREKIGSRPESADQGSAAINHYALKFPRAPCREQAVSAAADAVSSLQSFVSFLDKQKRKNRDYDENKITTTDWIQELFINR